MCRTGVNLRYLGMAFKYGLENSDKMRPIHSVELWCLVRKIRRYEPGIADCIELLVRRCTSEQVRRSADGNSGLSPYVSGALAPSRLWTTYDAANILAGPCKQSQGSFSYLMRGPYRSAFHGLILKVTIMNWWGSMTTGMTTCSVVHWPSEAPIWHANAVSDSFKIPSSDAHLLHLGCEAGLDVDLLGLVTRISAIVADPTDLCNGFSDARMYKNSSTSEEYQLEAVARNQPTRIHATLTQYGPGFPIRARVMVPSGALVEIEAYDVGDLISEVWTRYGERLCRRKSVHMVFRGKRIKGGLWIAGVRCGDVVLLCLSNFL